MTKEEEANLIKDVAAIKQCLLGYDGHQGLVKSHEELKKDHSNLKRIVIGLLCFLGGSGLLVGSVVGISSLLGG